MALCPFLDIIESQRFHQVGILRRGLANRLLKRRRNWPQVPREWREGLECFCLGVSEKASLKSSLVDGESADLGLSVGFSNN